MGDLTRGDILARFGDGYTGHNVGVSLETLLSFGVFRVSYNYGRSERVDCVYSIGVFK